MNLEATSSNSSDILETAARLSSLARRLVKDAHTAEDIVQEALTQSLRSGPVEARERLRWLGGIVRLQVKNLSRRNRNRIHRESVVSVERQSLAADEVVERLEAIELVSRTLRDLEDPYRSTIARLYLEELSTAEIAKQDSVEEGTVRWRHSVGLSRMRAILDQKFGGERNAWCIVLARLDRQAPAYVAAGLTGLHMALICIAVIGSVISFTILRTDTSRGVVTVADKGAGQNSTETLARTLENSDQALPAAIVHDSQRAALASRGQDQSQPQVSRAELMMRVTDRHRLPLRGIRIIAAADEEDYVATTLEDGTAHFEFEQLNGKPSSVGLTLERTGMLPIVRGVELFSGQVRDIGDVVLEPTGTIEGIVRGPNGLPRPGVQVMASLPNHPNIDRVFGALGYASGAISLDTSDDEGRFRLEQVRAGAVGVFAQSDDTLCSQALVTLAPNSQVTGVDITLVSLPDANTISGHVLDEFGRPVDNASVTYGIANHDLDDLSGPAGWDSSEYKPVNTVNTDSAGGFTVRVRNELIYDFYAQSGERLIGTTAAYGITAGTRDVSLVFRSPQTVSARVAFPNGSSVDEYTVQVWNVARTHLFLEVNSKASALLVPTPNEPCVLLFISNGCCDELRGPFDPTTAMGSTRVDFVNAPRIRGRITELGQPVSGAYVELHLPRPNRDQYEIRYLSTTSSTDGSYELSVPVLLPGQRRPLVLLGPGCEPRYVNVQDVGRGLDGVDFEVSPGGSVEVLVRGDGASVRSGRLVLLWPTGSRFMGEHYENPWTPTNFTRPRQALTNPGGVATITDLRPLRYSIAIEHTEAPYLMEARVPPDRARVYECEVRSGQVTRIEIDLDDALPVTIEVSLFTNGTPAVGWVGQLLHQSECADSRDVWGSASDSNGVIQLEAPYRGEWVLRLQPPQTDVCRGWVDVPVKVSGDGTTSSINLRMGAIRGSCASGAGVRLAITTEQPGRIRSKWSVLTGAGGNFELAHVLAGPAEILAAQVPVGREDGLGPESHVVDIPAGTIPVDVRIP